MQTDMSLSNDSFTAAISNGDNKIPGLSFNISVKPLVKQEISLVALVDNSTPITIQHLDATKLAGLTTSNPVYYILNKPKYGKIKRILRTSRTREPRSIRDREVWHFTHEDLKNGVIYFVGSNLGIQVKFLYVFKSKCFSKMFPRIFSCYFYATIERLSLFVLLRKFNLDVFKLEFIGKSGKIYFMSIFLF